VHRLALDEYFAADYGVDGAPHRQELGGVGELVRARDLLDEDVLPGDLASPDPGLFFCLHIEGEREIVTEGQGIVEYFGASKKINTWR
jgi:hypothetical protein